MGRIRHTAILAIISGGSLVVGTLAGPSPALAGLADKIKKSVGDQAKKVEQAKDDATKATAEKPAAPAGANEGDGAAAGPASADNGKVSGVSTKFDYVPGDRVLFADDFTQDDLGEFPARWTLGDGTFETAEMSGERWLRCTSTSGRVRMKVPPGLPEFWTLEFDYYCENHAGQIPLNVSGIVPGGKEAWYMQWPVSGQYLGFHSGSIASNATASGSPDGRRHFALMARGRGLKVYVDRERLANVPEIHVADGAPNEIEFGLGANNPPMITNVRFAEGCRPAKDLLAEGKLVTYGIRFATGSDVVLAESAPILRQVASWLETNAQARLRITGHTDNVGSPASNLDLSKRRAASVAKVLSGELGVAAGRLETDGKGDTDAVASNAKPEGRAMNRRVEFAKL